LICWRKPANRKIQIFKRAKQAHHATRQRRGAR
jgi:hypothetical protein